MQSTVMSYVPKVYLNVDGPGLMCFPDQLTLLLSTLLANALTDTWYD
jgi:hypothetical protein